MFRLLWISCHLLLLSEMLKNSQVNYRSCRNSVFLAIENERVENGNVGGVPQRCQVRFREFEFCGELLTQLPNTVEV